MGFLGDMAIPRDFPHHCQSAVSCRAGTTAGKIAETMAGTEAAITGLSASQWSRWPWQGWRTLGAAQGGLTMLRRGHCPETPVRGLHGPPSSRTPLLWLCWDDPTAQDNLHGLPLHHHHPRKEGHHHSCSLGLGRDHIVVPFQLKEVTRRVATGIRRCGTVGAKAGGHHHDTTQVPSTPSDFGGTGHTDEGRTQDPLVTQVPCIPPQAARLG